MISYLWQVMDASGDASMGTRKDGIWGISDCLLLKVFYCCCILSHFFHAFVSQLVVSDLYLVS